MTIDEIYAKQARALLVLLLTPHILRYLTTSDPTALRQGRESFSFCIHCGSGEPGMPGSEHKHSCPLWVEDTTDPAGYGHGV